ncbi:MAG: carbohydrate kinase [Rhodobacteraceae bacterium]|nr:carbohydrate kinase [Paracoccaceae bacterium]MBR9821058.1 carbohydrate kinase [Paracoccaceae bacterium]
MRTARHVAVIDVGKTNAKLALVDTLALEEIAVVTRPNTVRPGPPYPHFDLEGHWEFFLTHLRAFHESHGIDGISITTHGAAAVLLDAGGGLACPMLDYEHSGPDDLAQAYDALRPPFAQTGAARLPMGLNLGAQLHWLLETQPGLRERLAHVVTYPQYWGYRLTGRFATDVSSLGCHTDLWNPWEGRLSDLPGALGIADAMAPAHRASDVLGMVSEEVAALTGLDLATPVLCGIHDSNASLLPHLQRHGGAFSVVSTGTWVVCMSVAGRDVPLDPARDVLVNVSAHGDPVPSARFMGGREFELIRDGSEARPTDADRDRVLETALMLLPSVVTDSGPFAGRSHRWTAEPASDGERIFALSLYLALMTRTCLDLIGAEGPVVVEGPFARNPDFLAMLATLTPGGVEVSASATGTSIGAALLFGHSAEVPPPRRVPVPDSRLAPYARLWQAAP